MRIKNFTSAHWVSVGESWRYAIIVFVVARLLFGLWSWVIYTIQPVALQNFQLSGEPILSIFVIKDSQRYIYNREVNGQILTFQSIGSGRMIDQQSGTVWNIASGQALEGKYKGQWLSASGETQLPDLFPYQETKPYPGTWLSMWQRFDANLYVTIAEHGYGTVPGDTHFPPLFPLLIRLLQPVLGSAYVAGLVVSNAATLYMLKLLGDIFMEWGGLEIGKRAVLFFVIYPAFFFFFSAYSEAGFLVCVLLSLRTMRSRAWAWSGFWTFCAILTRLQGVALLVPMIYLMWSDPPFLRRSAHWAGLVLAGMGGLLYLSLRSLGGAGTVVPTVESEWQARLALPGESYLYAIKTMIAGHASFIDLLNLVIATLFVILLISGWKKVPIAYNLFALCNLFILSIRVVETQPLNSMIRFSLTLFPVFFTLSLAGQNPWVRRVIIYTSVPLSLYLSGQFFIWGWVA